jgi:hypothetical protein
MTPETNDGSSEKGARNGGDRRVAEEGTPQSVIPLGENDSELLKNSRDAVRKANADGPVVVEGVVKNFGNAVNDKLKSGDLLNRIGDGVGRLLGDGVVGYMALSSAVSSARRAIREGWGKVAGWSGLDKKKEAATPAKESWGDMGLRELFDKYHEILVAGEVDENKKLLNSMRNEIAKRFAEFGSQGGFKPEYMWRMREALIGSNLDNFHKRLVDLQDQFFDEDLANDPRYKGILGVGIEGLSVFVTLRLAEKRGGRLWSAFSQSEYNLTKKVAPYWNFIILEGKGLENLVDESDIEERTQEHLESSPVVDRNNDAGLSDGRRRRNKRVRVNPSARGEERRHGRYSHSITDYKNEGFSDEGIFAESGDRGLLAYMGGKRRVHLNQAGLMVMGGEYDLLIEFNKFANGKGNLELLERLLNVALPGEKWAERRASLIAIATFYKGIDTLGSSADMSMLIDRDKGVLAGDPRFIAKFAVGSDDFLKAFGYYWEMYSKINREVADGSYKPGDFWSESDLKERDRILATEIGCSQGVVMLARHFVSDYGVFPQQFKDYTKLINRYPRLLDPLLRIFSGGMGLTLVEVDGERGGKDGYVRRYLESPKLGESLQQRLDRYRQFFEIYSSTAAKKGNNDPAWSAKMWGGVGEVKDLVDVIYKNVLKFVKKNPTSSFSRFISGAKSKEWNRLIEAGVFTPDRKLPIAKKIASNADSTKPFKEEQFVNLVGYLFGLEPAEEGGGAFGAFQSKEKMPGLFKMLTIDILIGDEDGIVRALGKSRVRNRRGMDGDVLD